MLPVLKAPVTRVETGGPTISASPRGTESTPSVQEQRSGADRTVAQMRHLSGSTRAFTPGRLDGLCLGFKGLDFLRDEAGDALEGIEQLMVAGQATLSMCKRWIAPILHALTSNHVAEESDFRLPPEGRSTGSTAVDWLGLRTRVCELLMMSAEAAGKHADQGAMAELIAVIRPYSNHLAFQAAMTERLNDMLADLPDEAEADLRYSRYSHLLGIADPKRVEGLHADRDNRLLLTRSPWSAGIVARCAQRLPRAVIHRKSSLHPDSIQHHKVLEGFLRLPATEQARVQEHVEGAFGGELDVEVAAVEFALNASGLQPEAFATALLSSAPGDAHRGAESTQRHRRFTLTLSVALAGQSGDTAGEWARAVFDELLERWAGQPENLALCDALGAVLAVIYLRADAADSDQCQEAWREAQPLSQTGKQAAAFCNQSQYLLCALACDVDKDTKPDLLNQARAYREVICAPAKQLENRGSHLVRSPMQSLAATRQSQVSSALSMQ